MSEKEPDKEITKAQWVQIILLLFASVFMFLAVF